MHDIAFRTGLVHEFIRSADRSAVPRPPPRPSGHQSSSGETVRCTHGHKAICIYESYVSNATVRLDESSESLGTQYYIEEASRPPPRPRGLFLQ